MNVKKITLAAGLLILFFNIAFGQAPAAIVGAGSVCAGSRLTLTDATGGGTWSCNNTGVATITSGGVVGAVASGIAVISYTTSGGTATAVVTVNPTPASAAFTVSSPVCAGSGATFTRSAYNCSGNALSFATSGAAATGALVTTNTNNITIEGWVKWNGPTGNNQFIFYNGNSGGNGYGLMINAGSNSLSILCGGVSFLNSTVVLAVGVWQHVAIVRNAGTWSIYMDGVAYSVSSATVTPNTPSGNFLIGSPVAGSSERFNGSIDDVLFWITARSTAQIQADRIACSFTTPQTGLNGYWKFEEGSGGTTGDPAGGNSLTLNATSWVALNSFICAFGDAGTASTSPVSHTYATAGAYTATLTVSNTSGCSIASTSTLVANTAPSAAFSVSASTVCVGNSITFTAGATACNTRALIFSSATSANRAVFSTLTNNVTLEGWVRWNGGTAANQAVWYNGSGGSNGYGLFIDAAVGNTLSILCGGVAYLGTSATLPVGTWTHVAIVRNAGSWALYVNGLAYPVNSPTATPNTPTGLFAIGGGGAQYFNGAIDEVMFWTTARTAAQITTDRNACSISPTTGLIGYWRMEEGTGSTTADASGNGRSLTLTSPSWGTATPGTNTYAWNFNDGGTSAVANPAYTYATSATRTPSLTVTGSTGCTALSSAVITVGGNSIVADATISALTPCASAGVTLTAGAVTGAIAAYYSWSGPNSYSATSVAPTIVFTPGSPAASGSYSLTATSYLGCTGNQVSTSAIAVQPSPVSSFSPNLVCPGTSVTFSPCNNYAGDRLTHLSMPVFLTATDNITLECWLKWDGTVPVYPEFTQYIFINGKIPGEVRGYSLQLHSSGQLSFGASVSSGSSFGLFYLPPIDPNTWLHLAIVRRSGTWYSYLNGVETIQGNFTPDVPLNNFLLSSQTVGGSNGFRGIIDEFSVWSVARTQAEIQADMAACSLSPQSGLEAYWPFSEGSSSTGAIDRSGNGRNAAGEIVQTTATPSLTTGYAWSFGDGGTSTLPSPGYNYTTPGTYTASLTATGNNGCTSSSSNSITAIATTVASISPSATSLCAGSPLTLTAGAAAGPGALVSYNWSGPNGYSATSAAPTISFTPTTAAASGSYSVSITRTTGCTSTRVATAPVTVISLSSIVTSSPTVCAGSGITLSNSTSGGTWTSGSPSTAVVEFNGVVTGLSGGTSVITYTVGGICAVTATITVSGVRLSYSSSGATGTICAGGSLDLNSDTAAASTYSWDGPNGFSSTLRNPTIPSVSTTAQGKYIFTATTAGCPAATHQLLVAIDEKPTVVITPSAAINVCSTSVINLYDSAQTLTTDYVIHAVLYAPLTLTAATTVPTNDDGYTAALLPFPFVLYGTSYTTVYINTNGSLTFGAAHATNSAIQYPLPNGNYNGKAVIAFGNVDLNTITGGSIAYQTFGTAPNRRFVVYYKNCDAFHYSGAAYSNGYLSGQIILYETSNAIDLMIDHSDPSGAGGPWTFGIQNSTATQAVPVPDLNATYIPVVMNQGWRFAHPSYSYSWSPAAGLSSTSIVNPVVSGLTATRVYSVSTIDVNSACTSGTVATKTINYPKGVNLGADTICQGASVTLSGTGAATYSWSPSAGLSCTSCASTIATPTVTTTYTFTGTVSAGCSGTNTVTVNVWATPSVTAVTSSSSVVCIGTALTLSSGASSGVGTFRHYSWAGPGGYSLTSATPSVSFTPATTASSGTYSLAVIYNSGCASLPVTTPVTVNARPMVSGVTSSGNLCLGAVLTLTAGSVTGAGSLTSYNWSGPNSYLTTGTSISIGFIPAAALASGNYSLSVTYAGTGCTSNVVTTSPVTVSNLPTAAGITPSASAICVGATLTLTAGAIAGTGTLASYNWIGPGSYSATSVVPSTTRIPTNTTASGNYSLSVTYTGAGCTSAGVASVPVTVNPLPAATGIALSSPAVCRGAPVTLTATGITNTDASTIYSWRGPGGYTATTALQSFMVPSVTGANTYSVTLTNASTGCSGNNAISPIVSVNPLPVAAFSAPDSSCAGVVSFTPGTASPCGAYGLNTGTAGTISRTTVSSVTNNLTLEVKVKWGGGTGDDQFIIYNGNNGSNGYGIALISANFNRIAVYCGGVAVLNSLATLTAGVWQHVAIVRNAGTWSVYLDGVQYAVTNAATAPNTPASVFNIGSNGFPAGTRLNGSVQNAAFWSAVRTTAQIQSDMAACSLSPQTGLQGFWKFDDGIGATAADGSGNGRSLTLSGTTWITPAYNTYAWNFGDGATSSLVFPTNGYSVSSVYTPSLSITDPQGCSATSSRSIFIRPQPVVAGITASAGTLCVGSALTLTSGTVSGGGTISSYNWSGPNGYSTTGTSAATGFMPGTTAASGVYSLMVKYTGGCTSAVVNTTSVTVNAQPTIVSITPSTTTLCFGNTLTLTAGAAAGTGGLLSYNWSGPGGYSTTGTSPAAIIIPTNTAASGNYSLSVTYPGTGCISAVAATPSITVSSLPTLSGITPSATSLCAGSALALTAGAATGAGVLTSYNWAGPNGYIATGTSATALLTPTTTAAGGIYSLSVTFPGTDCISPVVTTPAITVNPQPTVTGIAPSTTSSCIGSALTMSAGVVTGGGTVSSYNWSGPNGYSTTNTAPTNSLTPATVAASGVYSLTITYIGGCTSAAVTTAPVSVYTPPVANFTIPDSACSTPVIFNALPYCSPYGINIVAASSVSGSAISMSTDNISMEAWVKWQGGSVSGDQMIMYNGNRTSNGFGIAVNPTTHYIRLYFGGISISTSFLFLPMGTWQHVAAVRRAGRWHLYMNGWESLSTTVLPNAPTTAFHVGPDGGGLGWFVGHIDNVMLWSVARTDAEIYADMQACSIDPQPGLEGYWKFEEAAGTTAADASGNGHTLALLSTTWVGQAPNSYLWSFGDGTTSTQLSAPHTYTTASVFAPTLTVTNPSGCSATSSRSVVIKPNPFAGSITGDTIACGGASITLSDTAAGGVWSSSNPLLATVAGCVIAGLSTGTATVSYAVANSCGTATATKTIHLNPMEWTGTTSNDWNTTSNWTCGRVPTVTDDILIPVATTSPILPSMATGNTRRLTLMPGATITLGAGAHIDVKGDLSYNGIIGEGKIHLSGTSAQKIQGIARVSDLELNNPAGVTIDTGSRLTIAKELTITNGTLTTNDSLVLASDINGSARIAELPAGGAAIEGKVKVQQYIQANYRRYRFWAHPFSTALSLSQLRTYMDITGTGGAANGFTTTGTNAPSAFRLDPYTANSTLGYDPGWKPITKIDGTEADSNKVQPHQGLRLFMRGAKGQGLGGFAYTPLENIVAMSGPVNQGDQTVVLHRGHGPMPTQQDYNMVGNPYPSPVDIGTAIYNASLTGNVVGAAYYVYNASLGVAGQFQAVLIGTSAPEPYSIQANACFQVRAGFDSAEIHFRESMKTTAPTTYLLKPASKQYVSLNVYDANYHPWDMLTIMFNDAASDNEDVKLDAVKPSGADFNFYSLSGDNKKMVVDSRSYATDKIISLGVNSSYQQDFIIRADNVVLPEYTTLYLHDKLLNKKIELNAGTEYKFSISKDRVTQGDNRFELALKHAQVLVTSEFSVTMSPNPATEDVKITFALPATEQVSIRVIDITGLSVYASKLGVQQNGSVTIPLAQLASGVYMVELSAGDKKVVQRLVKE